MQVRRNARLAELTTLGVGGPIDRLVEVTDAAELVAAVGDADACRRKLESFPVDDVVVVPATAGDPGGRRTLEALRPSRSPAP